MISMKIQTATIPARAILLAGAALAALMAGNTALAQDRPAASAGEMITLEEIVVTARRRVESLQDAPLSVTAFAAQDLNQRGADTVSDLLNSIPNVTPINGLQIRGIGYNTRNIGIEAGATVYVDGVYTGRPASFDQDLADIAQVEVLRGPQGTLFGKNSIAGVINITTAEPTRELSGAVMGSYGNRNAHRLEATLNAPLGDMTAFRVSFNSSAADGYMRNVIDDQVFNGHDSSGLRAALKFEPAESLSVTLRADHYRRRSNPNNVETLLGDDPQRAPPRPVIAPGAFTAAEDTVPDHRLKLQGLSATVNYELATGDSLTSITALRRNEQRVFEGDDDSPVNAIEINWFNRQKQFSEELRLNGSRGAFNYVAGLYYFTQDSYQSNEGILGTDFAIPPLGIPPGVRKIIDPNATIKTDSYAAFLDVTYALTPALEIQGGLRYGHEKKKFDFEITSDAPALFYAFPRGRDAFSDEDLSPTLGLRYRFSPDLMAYGRYAKGYKSGGWNADFISRNPAQPNPPRIESLRFEAETAETFEIGFKSQLFDRSLTLNTAAFHTNFSNLQVAQFFGINLEAAGGQLAVTANAGKAIIKGVEVEAVWSPFDGFQLSGGLGYQDAAYDRFRNIDGRGTNADGRTMAGVPEWTGNVTLSQGWDLSNGGRVTLRGDYSNISSRFGDPTNNPARVSPAFWSANGRVTYALPDDRWEVSLWSRNITNRRYVLNYGIQQFAVQQAVPVRTVTYGEPRTYGVELRARF